MIVKDPKVANLEFHEILTQEQLYDEYVRLNALLDKSIDGLYAAGKEAAETNHAYRMKKSTAIIQIKGGKNKDEREAIAGPMYENEKFASELAANMKDANEEEVRARRTQLSALQTLIAARRSEFEANAYGQGNNNGA